MAREPMKDVIVLLPGILGSVLQRDGKDVWAMSAGAAFRGLLSMGKSIEKLQLHGDDAETDDLGDGVVATGLLPDLHLVPGLWKIDGYGAIAKELHERFELVDGQNYFEFPYDWRRDNRVHGRRLARQAHDWLANWRESSGNTAAQLILLAHSMGGLVSRAYLELYDGWKDTKALITFGTPYRGSLNAVDFLVSGMKRGFGPIGIDLTDFLRSLTSVYQLLPIYPAIETEGALLRVAEIEIPGIDQVRAAEALAFHRSIEYAVEQHSADSKYADGGYRIHPIVGIGQPTLQSARLDGDAVTLLRTHGGRDHSGDGTVPRVSAMPIEMTDAADGVFSPAVHSSIQNTENALTQVTGIITGADIDLGAFRDRYAGISIDLPDLVDAAAGLRIAGRPTGGRDTGLTATVTDADSGVVAWSGSLIEDVEWHVATTPPLSPGIYRVAVASETAELTDLVWAAGPE
ncbi:MAG: esterase/lipase family protein [Acidimicrobiales bacterium]